MNSENDYTQYVSKYGSTVHLWFHSFLFTQKIIILRHFNLKYTFPVVSIQSHLV